MKTIFMGLNTEPIFELPEKYNELPEPNKKYFDNELKLATSLKKEIEQTLAEDGACSLSWECTGRTRHAMHAEQWEAALPQYEFEIGYNYVCNVKVRKAK